MPVIDCHQHFWTWGKRAHKFPPAAGTRLDRDFTPEDLRPQLKKSGVDGTILVQSLNDLDETREFLDLSREIDTAMDRALARLDELDASAGADAASSPASGESSLPPRRQHPRRPDPRGPADR